MGDQGITDEERALRREAVRRLTAFEARNQAILASGSATPEARDFYRRHLQDWRAAYAQLRRQERQGVRIARAPVVLSTEVTSLRSFQDNAAEIVLVRCLDRSDLGVTRNGVPVPPTYEEPVAQEVVVERYENRTWRLGPFVTTDRPCRP